MREVVADHHGLPGDVATAQIAELTLVVVDEHPLLPVAVLEVTVVLVTGLVRDGRPRPSRAEARSGFRSPTRLKRPKNNILSLPERRQKIARPGLCKALWTGTLPAALQIRGFVPLVTTVLVLAFVSHCG